jgi:hypothetical protein
MTDLSPGPGWWLAADGKWYPPETQSDDRALPKSNSAVLSGQPRCRNCGSTIPADGQFCEQCGDPLGVTATGTGSTIPVTPSVSPSDGPTVPTLTTTQVLRPVPTIPGTRIALSEGENLLRAYPLLHFRPFRNRATGTLYVTDSRIVLYSVAHKLTGRTSTMHEVRIESVKGVTGYIDRGLGLVGTIVYVLAVFACIFTIIKGAILVGIVLLVFLALIYLISYHYGRLGLMIYTQQVTPGAIAFGYRHFSRIGGMLGPVTTLFRMIFGVNSQDVLGCFPERNAEDIISELGALVFDLNRIGTLEGTQWEPQL